MLLNYGSRPCIYVIISFLGHFKENFVRTTTLVRSMDFLYWFIFYYIYKSSLKKEYKFQT